MAQQNYSQAGISACCHPQANTSTPSSVPARCGVSTLRDGQSRVQPCTAPQLSHTMDQAAAERKKTGRRAVCQEGLEGTNISQLKCQGCPSFVWLRHSSAHLKNVDILLDTVTIQEDYVLHWNHTVTEHTTAQTEGF